MMAQVSPQLHYIIIWLVLLSIPASPGVLGQMSYSIPNTPADLPQGRWPGAESNLDLFAPPPTTPSGAGSLKSVSSLAQLKAVALTLVAGDILELTDGSYTNGGVEVSGICQCKSHSDQL